MELLEEARKLTASNSRACLDDIELLSLMLESLGDDPLVVQIGASDHGVFAFTVFGSRPDARLYVIDPEAEALHWQATAFEAVGVGYLLKQYPDATIVKELLPADLVIIDPCPGHDYDSVWQTLSVWTSRLRREGILYMHDYGSKVGPVPHPEVAKACNDRMGQPFLHSGWSAVWMVNHA